MRGANARVFQLKLNIWSSGKNQPFPRIIFQTSSTDV